MGFGLLTAVAVPLFLTLTTGGQIVSADQCTNRFGYAYSIHQCQTGENYNQKYCDNWHNCVFGGEITCHASHPYYWQCAKCNPGYKITGESRGKTTCAGGPCPGGKLQLCSYCKPGHKCDGTRSEVACGKGYYSGWTQSSCSACQQGRYTDQNAQGSCKSCTPGRYGSCSAGQCDDFNNDCKKCGPGKYQASYGQTGCSACAAGKYGSGDGNNHQHCEGDCSPGFYCPEGSTSSKQHSCSALTDPEPNKKYCKRGSGAPKSVSSGYYTTGGETEALSGHLAKYYRTDQQQCPKGTYCQGGVKYACPVGFYQEQTAQTSCTKKCKPGYYCNNNLATGVATSSEPGIQFRCGRDKTHPAAFYCPNTAAPYQPKLVSPNHYTLCALEDSDMDLVACPESRRERQKSCDNINAEYVCENGNRYRWIVEEKCEARVAFPEGLIGEPLEDVTVTIGSNNGQQKEIAVNTGSERLICPPLVDKSNWLGTETYSGEFTITAAWSDADGNTVYAERTDGSHLGWGMHLRFKCKKLPASLDARIQKDKVEFKAYKSATQDGMPVFYSFGAGEQLDECQRYIWERLNQEAFQWSGMLILGAGKTLDFENGENCKDVLVPVIGRNADSSKSSKACSLRVNIEDKNDAPLWLVWNMGVQVDEDTEPKTIIGDHGIEVRDPDSDEVTFAIQEIHCGGNVGCESWFEIGRCDGRLRVKPGATGSGAIRRSAGGGKVEIKIRAQDSTGVQATLSYAGDHVQYAMIEVEILDKPNPPELIGPDYFEVAENLDGCSGGAVVACRLISVVGATKDVNGMIIASNPDGSPLQFVNDDATDTTFYVEESSGAVYLTRKLNFEALTGGLTLRIKVRDLDHGFEDTKSYKVNIINKNDPPVPLCATGLSVIENTPLHELLKPEPDAVTAINDEDCNGGVCALSAVQYTVLSPETCPVGFLSPNNPQLQVVDSTILDFETISSFSFTVSVRDQGIAGSHTNTLAATCVVTIEIEDVNEAPVVPGNQTFSIVETAETGTVLAHINATDPDNGGRFMPKQPGDPQRQILKYFVSADTSTDPGKFRFKSEYSGNLSTAGLLDYDSPTATRQYTLVIRVEDNAIEGQAQVQASIVINILPENEAPVINIPNVADSPSLPENSDATVTIQNRQLKATDPDGDSVSFSLLNCSAALSSGSNACLFSIPVGMNYLEVNAAAGSYDFNFEQRVSYFVLVEASDGHLSSECGINIFITNANDPPTLAVVGSDSTVAAKKGSPEGTAVATFTAHDEDLASVDSETVSIQITSCKKDGVNCPYVRWKLTSGDVKRKEAQVSVQLVVENDGGGRPTLDEATNTEWALTLTATDSQNAIAELSVTIRVDDTNVAPVIRCCPQPSFEVDENVPVSHLVASASDLVTDDSNVELFISLVAPVVNADADSESLKAGRLISNKGSGIGFQTHEDIPTPSIKTSGTFDFERFSSFTLRVSIRDIPSNGQGSLSVVGDFVVNVRDVNEPPVIEIKRSIFSLLENTVAGNKVGEVEALDPDFSTALTFSLLDHLTANSGDSSIFRVSNKGANVASIEVADSHKLDFEVRGNDPFVFGIRAKDSGELVADAVVEVMLQDVPEAPVLAETTIQVQENNDTWSACISYVDPDANSENTFSVNIEWMSVDSQGCVSGSHTFDYEDQEQWDVQVTAADLTNGFEVQETLHIRVKNVEDLTVTDIFPTYVSSAGGDVIIRGSNFGPTSHKRQNHNWGTNELQVETTVNAGFQSPDGIRTFTASCTIKTENTELSCSIPAGVGSSFVWTLQVGSQTLSDASLAFGYEAPVITSVTSEPFSTHGRTSFTISGSNFGPVGLLGVGNIEVRYGSRVDISNSGKYEASHCEVTIAHVQITCNAASGTGKDLKFWIFDLAGSQSEIFGSTMRYEAPAVEGLAVKTIPTRSTMETMGGTEIIISGTNFGPTTVASGAPDATEDIMVSYGPEGTGYTATNCIVSQDQEEIKCEAAAGTGASHLWIVTLGEQSSAVSSASLSYEAPRISRVTGAGIHSASTRGNVRITITGSGFGNSVINSVTHHPNIQISYGPGGRFSCLHPQMEIPDVRMTCVLGAGTGANLDMEVVVDRQNSDKKANAISYAPPVIIGYPGNGAQNGNTSGDEVIFIEGKNFGPVLNEYSTIDKVIYGSKNVREELWYTGRDCAIKQAHTLIQCKTQAGAGKDLHWKITISGLASVTPTTSYARPHISAISGPGADNSSANGGKLVTITGTNFGPLGKSRELTSVTYGPSGTRFQAKDCQVTKLSTEIQCNTAPGIGFLNKWIVTVAEQISEDSQITTSYMAPTITALSSTKIDTTGGLLQLTGTNFGTKVKGLTASVIFGSRMLTPEEFGTFDGEPEKDFLVFHIPALEGTDPDVIDVPVSIYLKLGDTTVRSAAAHISYNPPIIDKVFTYEADDKSKAALKLVIEGSNFCQSTECGAVAVTDATGNPSEITKYLEWSHSRISFEIGIDKGNIVIQVGSVGLGMQRSNKIPFEHMSPVIDNGREISAQRFPTKGGAEMVIEGRYFRNTNVEVWAQIADRSKPAQKGNVIEIKRVNNLGPHHYRIRAASPPGQGTGILFWVKLPAQGGLADAESEPLLISYKPPSSVAMLSHFAPTSGGNITFTGDDLGECAILTMDGEQVVSPTSKNNCTKVRDHREVTFTVPEGDGAQHTLGITVSDQSPDERSGWDLNVDGQCNGGQGERNQVGWFAYAPPVVQAVTPETVDTSGGTLVLHGLNFGVSKPTVLIYARNQESEACGGALCSIASDPFKTYHCGKVGCQKSACCGSSPSCGCYKAGCGCCTVRSTCEVVSWSHTRLECNVAAGYGKDLELVVFASGQHSVGGPLFAYNPPRITSVYPREEIPTRGGMLVTITGKSFSTANKWTKVYLRGDGSSGANGKDIGIELDGEQVVSLNHDKIVFIVPEGQGQRRHVEVVVDGQSAVYEKEEFKYAAPQLDRLVQPKECEGNLRDVSCGSPTVGEFILELDGSNFGTEGAIVSIGPHLCCLPTEGKCGGRNADCSCCVTNQDHEKITVEAPAGAGTDISVSITYNYLNWDYSTSMDYDPPHVNFVTPPVGNANGDQITLQGINFGLNISHVQNVSIGGVLCEHLTWLPAQNVDTQELSCFIPLDIVGPKSVEVYVEDQMSRWDVDEWSRGTGHRLFRTECPAHYHGRDGEVCFECPYVTDENGNVILDSKGDKQYSATCEGGEMMPVAKQGFFLYEVRRTCGGTEGGDICTGDGDCGNVTGSCSWPPEAEYCNGTVTSEDSRSVCTYTLACEPAEACDAANQCSVIGEGETDPMTGAPIEPHGYSNVTNTGQPVKRCSACARGYFRVGGLCELCPKNILYIAIIFVCAVIAVCAVAYLLHMFKINIAMASIGIDYFQVLSMFLKSEIRWPAAIKTIFRIMSSFNLDLDIASPECLLSEYYRYDIKWYSIMSLPVAMGSTFVLIHCILWVKKRCWQGRKKANQHVHAMVSMNLVMMYFLYLYLTRSALDVFNCVPLDPPDRIHPEYTYMQAVGGVRCYEPGSLQMQLLPFAVAAIAIYTIGYPSFLGYLLWRNKIRIQRDQYLRACGTGDKRQRDDLFNVYNVRKRYSAVYYQFKPRAYYWIVVIIARKFVIAAVNLLLRTDIDYMLAASLMILFVCFALQLVHKPYMGPAEYSKVREKWGLRTAMMSTTPIKLSSSNAGKAASAETRDRALMTGRTRSSTAVMRFATRSIATTKKLLRWLVNYNTVESILLFCACIISLGGIMFSSERFAHNKNQRELESLTWIVICVLVFSIVYYTSVVVLEIIAQLCPGFFRKRCCDLENVLGDGFTSRKKKRRLSQKVTFGKLGAREVELYALHANKRISNGSILMRFGSTASVTSGVTSLSSHPHCADTAVVEMANPMRSNKRGA